MDYVLGVDPGFNGAIACYRPKSQELFVVDMPVITAAKGRTVINHRMLFETLIPPEGQLCCFLEFVAARPGQGAPATFRFGQGYGAIEMALAAHNIPIREYVTPAKWKKHFGLSADKGASRGLATQFFPQNAAEFARAKDDGRAEAALIARYGADKLNL